MCESSHLRRIGDTLRERGWRLSVAESLTGGQVQALLTSVSGASDYFAGGLTAYNVAQKVALLAVDEGAARACNGVSAEIALQMARGANRLFGTHVALATTGYAEPAAAWQVRIPFAFCGVVRDDDLASGLVQRIEAAGQSRQATQQMVAQGAIALLARFLESCVEAP